MNDIVKERASRLSRLSEDRTTKALVEEASRRMGITEKDDQIVITNGEPFIKALQSKIDELRTVLSADVNVNVDDLIEQLRHIKSIAPSVEDLNKTIAGFVIPDLPGEIEVVGLQKFSDILSSHISELKNLPDVQLPQANIKVDVEQIGREGVADLLQRLDDLIGVVRENTAPSQAPSDFMPIRRVQKIGNTLVFDDGYWGGSSSGGGGGSLLFTGQSSGVAESTSTIYDGNTALTPKFAVISTGSSGDNTIVPAVTDKKIRVLAYMFISSGNVTATWQSDSTNISGPMPLIASTGVSAGYNPKGHFETSTGESLQINQNSTAVLGGQITYLEI